MVNIREGAGGGYHNTRPRGGRDQGVGPSKPAHAAGETGMRMAKVPRPGPRYRRGTKFLRLVDRPSLFDIIKLTAESFSVLFWQEQ